MGLIPRINHVAGTIKKFLVMLRPYAHICQTKMHPMKFAATIQRRTKVLTTNLFGVTIPVFFVFFSNILENMPNQANHTNPQS
ncbi:MAG: hypothetical protein EAZ23_05625 [Oscillatoriales cyanobacterium]|nr:MAG: hypothetical protein EAZ23_05625 [Oscillatoriales cyanobacterium]